MPDDDWDFSRPLTGPAPRASRPEFGRAGDGGATSDSFGSAPFPSGEPGPTFDFDGNRLGAGSTPFGPGTAGPPFGWLLAATVGAAIGIAIAAVSLPGVVYYTAAWVVCGPVSIGLLTVFARRDAQKQTILTYGSPSWSPTAYRVVVILCLLAVIGEALRIADWAGHR